MSGLGQKAKYSLRADVFRFAPDSGHPATAAVFPFRAENRPLREWRPLADCVEKLENRGAPKISQM
jgi:hypothetical protein